MGPASAPAPQTGKYFEVADYRLSEATPDNERAANYYCARYTTNGIDIVQRCDPPSRLYSTAMSS